MNLSPYNPIGFIPTADAVRARAFYEQTLGLECESEDQFAIVFRVGFGRTMLRVAITPGFTPAPYTIFGWEVGTLADVVNELTAAGVPFQRYEFLEQDALGIWNAPSGARVAWFKDPDGNTLSLSQHPG